MHTPLSMEEQVRSKSNKLQVDGKVLGKKVKIVQLKCIKSVWCGLMLEWRIVILEL